MVVAVSQSTIAKRFRITSPLSAYCSQARVPVTLIRIPTNSLPRFRLGTSLFITLSNANAFFFISAPAIYQRRRDNGSFSPYVTIHVIRKVCLYRVRMHIEYQAYNGVRFTRIDRIQMRINLGENSFRDYSIELKTFQKEGGIKFPIGIGNGFGFCPKRNI